MPVESDNTNLVVGNWDMTQNETFGSHLRQYTLSRQNYTGSWRISQGSVELVKAVPTNQHINDHCLSKSNWLALADLYTRLFHEYDWRYHQRPNISSDSTLLASMVWSRLAAVAPDTKINLSDNPLCEPDGLPQLRYDTPVDVEVSAVTIKHEWEIAVILGLYPAILFLSLSFRVISQPLTPIGEGFGLVSLLASIEKKSLTLLKGASLSGKLDRPVFVGFSTIHQDNITGVTGTCEVVTSLGTQEIESDKLNRRTTYS